MKERKLPSGTAGRDHTGRPFSLLIWHGAMGVVGFGFGLIAERRPFGDDILLHPLVVFFALAMMALLVLRIMLKRPVPEVIPDRALMLGCALGLAMFLAGNFVGVHALPLR